VSDQSVVPWAVGFQLERPFVVTSEQLSQVGERIWNLTRMFNVREGFTRKEDSLPARLKRPLKNGGPADDEGKAIPRAAAQKSIQFRKLPPLALVAHPEPLLRIPAARAMEEKERIACCAPVLFIQFFDSRPGQQ